MENEGEYLIQQVTCVPFSIIFPKNPAYLGVLQSLGEPGSRCHKWNLIVLLFVMQSYSFSTWYQATFSLPSAMISSFCNIFSGIVNIVTVVQIAAKFTAPREFNIRTEQEEYFPLNLQTAVHVYGLYLLKSFNMKVLYYLSLNLEGVGNRPQGLSHFLETT